MKDFLCVFKYSMLLLGTIIGAGLASGQEIVVFFAQYGFCSLFFLILLFFLFTYSIKLFLEFGQQRKVIYEGKNMVKISKILNYFYLTIFTITSASMLAGLNELLNQTICPFSFPIWSLIFIIISTIITFFGLKLLLNLSVPLIPLILVSIFFVCLKSITVSSLSAPAFSTDLPTIGLLILSSISYACCNLVMANKMLFTCGKNLSHKNIKMIAYSVSTVLILLIGTIIICILANDNMVLFSELPMVYMAFLISGPVGYFFSFIIFLSILTTLFTMQYSFIETIFEHDNIFGISVTKSAKKTKRNFLPFLISGVIFYCLSLVGFSGIIKYIYPIIGAVGFILLCYIRNLSFKTRFNSANNKVH